MTDALLLGLTSLAVNLPTGSHGSRPAASAAPNDNYLCTTHSLLYHSDGSAWQVAGVLVPAGGTSGQTLVKASSTDYDLAWGSGGSGSPVGAYFAKTSAAGDITLTAPTSYTDIAGLSVSVAATAGDQLLVIAHVTPYSTAGVDPDIAIVVAGTAKSVGSFANQGVNVPTPIPVQWLHTVVTGDISGGNVAVKVQGRVSSGNLVIYNNATHGNTATVSVLNLGH